MNFTPLFASKKGTFVVDDTTGTGLLFATLFQKKPADYAILSQNLYHAQKIYECLLNFIPEEKVVLFPSDELLRAEALSSSKELMAQRLYAMGQLLDDQPKILITHPSALLRYLPSPDAFRRLTLHLKVGQEISLDRLKNVLSEAGYLRVNKIDQSMQFAIRGDIVDIFSVNELKPIRLEFFGDEIDSIKSFDIATQSSLSPLDHADILPATDMFLTKEQEIDFIKRLDALVQNDVKEKKETDRDTFFQNISADKEDLLSHQCRPSLYRYYGFATNEIHSILSYFHPDLVFIPDQEAFLGSANFIQEEARNYYQELVQENRIPTHLQQYMSVEEALHGQKVTSGSKFARGEDEDAFLVRPVVMAGLGLSSLVPTLNSYREQAKKIVFALGDDHQRESIERVFEEEKIPYESLKGYALPVGQIGISDASLNEGFDLPQYGIVYFSSNEVFGKKRLVTRFSNRFKNATILKSYQDLQPGDYVVHEQNGIGQFIQVKTMESDGKHRDYLEIAYAGNDKLFVPLEQFRLVRKYAGREGYAPKLSHLYSGDWEKRKAKIKGRVNFMADRLIALYGERAKVPGYAFPPDDELQERFEHEFPFALTPDQERSLEEIKHDMESPTPMDRLLCGDVGFGKTEIAFRAAFKAIDAGKQVAMLAPTTLLARQHFEVAQERFASFGVRIASLSRLNTLSEAKAIWQGISDGKIDFVIGTHRLLSSHTHFKNLGLLIIDEEQRFGVEQKEKIKEMKRDVDVLTLSATPIPRTLQMSLIGIRSVSTINTAPESRMPIQTYVTPYQESVVYELIGRELARDGQVFYLHNNVATIDSTASRIERHVPGARVGVVHGQMEKEESQEIMQRFYTGELNVLVATSIVENGIDVPNANMIIVEDADHFGLSQLYQIKGRVGRGNRVAYAYLMYRPNKTMSDEAKQRLRAIQDFTELGSGYKIAERDLMIRGAGDILGPEQAGFIDSVGLDLYLQLLHEAIEERQKGVVPEKPKPEVLFSIDAYIPKDYAIASDKIELYQDLENTKTEADVAQVAAHMRDVYGKLPEPVELLLWQQRISILSHSEEFYRLEQGEGYVDLLLSDAFTNQPHIALDLYNAMIPYLKEIRVNFVEKRIHVRLLTKDRKNWIHDLYQIMKAIHSLARSAKA